MLLGYNTNGFSSHALTDAIDIIAEIGYRSIAITLDHHALDPFAPDHVQQVENAREQLQQRDLECVVETGARFLLDPRRKHQPTLLSDDASERGRRAEFSRRAIDTAHMLGARVVSLWSGKALGTEHGGSTALDDRLAAELRSLCDYAASRDIAIGFEPEPGMYIETMTQYDRLAAAVNHPAFRLTLDVGHAHLTEDAGAEHTVQRYAEHIVNVHLEGMSRPHHDHLVPWEGELDVLGVVAALRDVGYEGPATFELSRHSHAAVDVARRAYDMLNPRAAGARSS